MRYADSTPLIKGPVALEKKSSQNNHQRNFYMIALMNAFYNRNECEAWLSHNANYPPPQKPMKSEQFTNLNSILSEVKLYIVKSTMRRILMGNSAKQYCSILINFLICIDHTHYTSSA